MKDIELTILRHLYINPLEGNFTKSVLINSLSIDKNILEDSLQNLINNKYIELGWADGENGNQHKMNDPHYRITGFGAKQINELDRKGLKTVINKYGTIISLIIGIIGAIGVGTSIYFDWRADKRGIDYLEIQYNQMQIQKQNLKQK